MLFESEPAFTPSEAEEFLQLARFFSLPKLNWILDLAKRFAKLTKMAIKNSIDANIPLTPDVIALTTLALLKDITIDTELLVPILRATLMALGTPTPFLKDILYVFGSLIDMQLENSANSN